MKSKPYNYHDVGLEGGTPMNELNKFADEELEMNKIRPVTKEAKEHMDKVDGKKDDLRYLVLPLFFIAVALVVMNIVLISIFNQ